MKLQIKNKLNAKRWILIILMVCIAARLVVIPLFAEAPHAKVDVYYANSQAAQLILDLQSPYTHVFSIRPDYQLDVFAYMPFVAVYYVPFYLLGDIRYGSILADVLITLSVYWIAQSINRGKILLAPFVYAILPFSIWLTSGASTNMMVGTAFLMLSLAAVMRKKFLLSSMLFGLALATNQLAVLAFPLMVVFFFKAKKLGFMGVSVLLTIAVVLPFMLSDVKAFVNDVVLFQFERQLQIDGMYSLYSLVYSFSGVALDSWVRISIFLLLAAASTVYLIRKPHSLVFITGCLMFLGAFILPVNGFWNYFLPSMAACCALFPQALDKLMQSSQQMTPLKRDLTELHQFFKLRVKKY